MNVSEFMVNYFDIEMITNSNALIPPFNDSRFCHYLNVNFWEKCGNLKLNSFLEYISNKLDSLYLSPTVENNQTYFNENVFIPLVYAPNEYKYNTLYQTTLQKYNPVENYNMTETGEDVKGKQENSNEITENATNTQNLGATKTVNTTDITNTNVYGKQTENIEMQKKQGETDTTTNKVSAYDNDSYSNDTQTTTKKEYDSNKDTQKTTKDTYTDTNTDKGTNTLNSDPVENTSTNVYKNVTINKDGERTDTHTLSRSGNIGVTTTQQMLQQERDIAYFNFIDIICNDLKKVMCKLIYEFEE